MSTPAQMAMMAAYKIALLNPSPPGADAGTLLPSSASSRDAK